MSELQYVKKRQLRITRLEIVSELYKRGYSIRQIQTEVRARLNLKTLSTRTIFEDVQFLLKEWKESRLSDIDAAIELELQRIDDTVRELWEQWERSKQDYVKESTKRKGLPTRKGNKDNITTIGIERKETNVQRLGDVSYISEIRAQLAERRKLLGLYAPEKKDITGDMSFASFLIESGIIDDGSEEK